MITHDDAHELINLLQLLMGRIELDKLEDAKDLIRNIADFIKLKTERKSQ